MILDVGPTIYLWIGAKANANEKKAAQSMAEVLKFICSPFMLFMMLRAVQFGF